MDIGKTVPLCFLICFISLFLGWGHSTAAEPELNKGIRIETEPDAVSSEKSTTIVKNPYGFLEYDGTGYRVVTREPKPDKASQVRMKPVTTKEKGTVYIMEVIDEKGKPLEGTAPVNSGPRIAVERLENVEGRKGVAPAPIRETKADVGVGVKVSESSEVLLGRGVVVESKDNKNPDSRDDGWRFRFKTHF
jgi:hypothetical protein